MSWDNVGPNQCHMDGTPIKRTDEKAMAKYDYGGGCPCGLYRECIPQCSHFVSPNKEQQPVNTNVVSDEVTITLDRELVGPLRNTLLDARRSLESGLTSIVSELDKCQYQINNNHDNPAVVINAWRTVENELRIRLDRQQAEYNTITFILESIEYSIGNMT